ACRCSTSRPARRWSRAGPRRVTRLIATTTTTVTTGPTTSTIRTGIGGESRQTSHCSIASAANSRPAGTGPTGTPKTSSAGSATKAAAPTSEGAEQVTSPLPMPAEFVPQEWLWIAFPHRADLWEEFTTPAQEQMAAYANAVAETGQRVRLVVHDAANEARARGLVSAAVELERHPYGDIWIRDTGPIVLFDEAGRRFAQRFGFNGWGGKYDDMEGDQEVGESLARTAGLEVEYADWVLEGGAIDTDGTGLVVTTEECLLNPNRNPDLSKADIEA